MVIKNYFNNYQNDYEDQRLFDDLITDAIQTFGLDVYYISRNDGTNQVNIDPLYLENPEVRFDVAYLIEMYLETNDSFTGQGDIFSKIGWEIRDEAVFSLSRARFEQVISNADSYRIRPLEGDLIFIQPINDFFEIKRVDPRHDDFFQGGNFYKYRLTCEKYEYSSEIFATGIPQIDQINSNRLDINTANTVIPPGVDSLALNDFFNTENTTLDIPNQTETNPFGSPWGT